MYDYNTVGLFTLFIVLLKLTMFREYTILYKYIYLKPVKLSNQQAQLFPQRTNVNNSNCYHFNLTSERWLLFYMSLRLLNFQLNPI